MLASIQKIISIHPIENADKIELAKVLGWQVVVEKGLYNPGDMCVFIEIDTIVPDKPDFEFLRNKNFRVKTIRLRGALSQGIIFPAKIVPPHFEGDDVTELLGIKKYEKPIPLAMRGVIRGNFPGFVPKTDETRIQAVPRLLCEMKGLICVSTVKMDGTSATYIHKDGDYHVCSRNMSFKLTEENKGNVYIEVGKKYGLPEKLGALGNYAVQGEICGPSVQKNRAGLKEIDLFVFNIYNIDEARYLDGDEMGEMIDKLELKSVPVLEGFVFDYKSMDCILKSAEGYYKGTKNRREGIVIRPIKEQYSAVLKGRMSFKVVNNEYLLKDEE